MVYKLKDWPSGEEFMALMPSRCKHASSSSSGAENVATKTSKKDKVHTDNHIDDASLNSFTDTMT